MRKDELPHRFGPEIWATIRATGEHVKVECWSAATGEYRVRSRKSGLLYPTDAELDEVVAHPEAHMGKYWSRCQAAGCGAPLTPGLPVCVRCQGLTCTCGRCACSAGARAAARVRSARKKVAVAEP